MATKQARFNATRSFCLNPTREKGEPARFCKPGEVSISSDDPRIEKLKANGTLTKSGRSIIE